MIKLIIVIIIAVQVLEELKTSGFPPAFRDHLPLEVVIENYLNLLKKFNTDFFVCRLILWSG